jgi:heat shock protein HslJ
MKTIRPSYLFLALMLLLISLSGCSKESQELAGTKWDLISLNGKGLIEGTAISLNFTKEHLGGETGCNLYGGSPDTGKYRATEAGELTLKLPFAVTVQYCYEPEGIMEQEAAYIEALMNAASFKVINNRLEVANDGGEPILVYQAK